MSVSGEPGLTFPNVMNVAGASTILSVFFFRWRRRGERGVRGGGFFFFFWRGGVRGTTLVSCLCVLHGVSFFCVKTARLPRGSRPQVQSLRGEGVKASSTILPAYPFFAPPRPLLKWPPRGRDPATQHILIDCDSSVHGNRSYHALETNSGSGAQKLTACAGVGCHVAAHTDPQPTHRFGCVQVSKAQPGSTATAQNSSNWASSFRKRSTFSKLRCRCEPFVCNCEE